MKLLCFFLSILPNTSLTFAEKGAEGGGTSSGESSGGPMTPERLKEIVESVNSEGKSHYDVFFRFVLRHTLSHTIFEWRKSLWAHFRHKQVQCRICDREK